MRVLSIKVWIFLASKRISVFPKMSKYSFHNKCETIADRMPSAEQKRKETSGFKWFTLCVTQSVSKLSFPLCVQCWSGIWGLAELIWSRWCGKVIIVLLFTHSQLTMYHLPLCEVCADNTPPVLAMWFSPRTCVTHYIYFHKKNTLQIGSSDIQNRSFSNTHISKVQRISTF